MGLDFGVLGFLSERIGIIIVLFPLICYNIAVYLLIMWENIQVNRILSRYLPGVFDRQLVLITGARQTGKTTLVKKYYHDLPYYNLDAFEYRDQLSSISTFKWAGEVGKSVIDEIQKEPALFDKIKYAFDEGSLSFSVLTGSSQILLLKRIQETLAGRITLRELFPFTFRELMDYQGENREPLLLEKLMGKGHVDEVLNGMSSILIGEDRVFNTEVEDWIYTWGGMPPLIHIRESNERKYWLKDYAIAYLERDLSNLASLKDLKPFMKFQQIAALRTANLISFTELARDSGIGIETSRRYLEYLRISYQAFLLQPYHKNLTSSLVKTPKLYWFDNGLQRHLSGYGYETNNGQLYENYVASEIMKFIRTNRMDAKLYFYRTRSGMEIDFILETNKGILGLEVKNREVVSSSDFTSLKKLALAAGKEWKAGIVIYRGNKIQNYGDRLWAIPSTRLFG